MQDWLKISLILCTFGFLREMRPSEPFVTEFLTGKWRNITEDQVNRDIYPLGTYMYLTQLVIVFLITDILRYKPIIVLSACIGIILWSLLLWTSDMLSLQLTQVCYGFFMSAEVAYYTYIYAKVGSDKYQQVTGHTRAALLIGKFLASILAQILISYRLMDYRELNYFSFGSQILSLVFVLMLPSVKTSLYFYSEKVSNDIVNDNDCSSASGGHDSSDSRSNYGRNIENGNLTLNAATLKQDVAVNKDVIVKFSCKNAIKLIWQHAYSAYTNRTVVQWSIWWSLAMCGYLQVASYIQLLWKEIDTNNNMINAATALTINHNNINDSMIIDGNKSILEIVLGNNQVAELTHSSYNGAVEAAVTLLGAVGAFTAGLFNSEYYQKWDLWILSVCSLFEGGFLIVAATTNSIWIAYVMYVLFGVVYFFMITIASATVAKNLIEDSFGLIFGINTMLALTIQTIFTVAVISNSGFTLNCRGQFMSFGGYFIVLAVLYIITGVFDELRIHRQKRTKLNENGSIIS